MAKQADTPGPIARMRSFFLEVQTEMSKVAWPSQDEVKASTSVVLVLLAILAVVVGTMDIVFRTVVVTLLRLA